jgi:alpha-tubulin suppressor-like RCC1 family protein
MKKLTILSTLLLCLLWSIESSAQTRGWGYNGNGELGIGNQSNQPTPLTISGLNDVTGIGGGYQHTLFLKADGTVLASGRNNNGQTGDGTTTSPRTSPVSVLNLTNVIQVTGGFRHSSALLSNGQVWGWGYNINGQIGNGTTTTTGCGCIPTPTQSTISNVVQIEAGGYHTLALRSDGTVWAWGYNLNGQLGDGTTTQRPTPFQISGLSSIIAVSAGDDHSMALKSDGTVYVWGRNSNGQVGNGTASEVQLTPLQNTTLSNVVQIAAGGFHNIALLKDGTVRVWGYNELGQVGNGSTSPSNQLTPLQTPGLTNVVEIEATGYTNTVRTKTGSVNSWGYNQSGQLGDGTTTTTGCVCKPSPTTNTTVGTGNSAIANGWSQGFALKPIITASTGTNQFFTGDNLRLTFAPITGAGDVSYTSIDPSVVAANHTVPAGYVIQTNQPAYDVTTTTTYSGNIDVCIEGINEFNPTAFANLKILHGEGANWVDRTYTSTFQRRQICARVTSLSPFVIAQGLAPTSASVSVSGRVIFSKGSISTRASVSLTDMAGNTRSVPVNPFGYYKFEDVSAGQTVTVQVSAKGASFAPQVVNVTEDVEDLNFSAQ